MDSNFCRAVLTRCQKVLPADLEPLSGPRIFGHARWRKDWVEVSSELAQDRQAWSAFVRDVVNSIGDADTSPRKYYRTT